MLRTPCESLIPADNGCTGIHWFCYRHRLQGVELGGDRRVDLRLYRALDCGRRVLITRIQQIATLSLRFLPRHLQSARPLSTRSRRSGASDRADLPRC